MLIAGARRGEANENACHASMSPPCRDMSSRNRERPRPARRADAKIYAIRHAPARALAHAAHTPFSGLPPRYRHVIYTVTRCCACRAIHNDMSRWRALRHHAATASFTDDATHAIPATRHAVRASAPLRARRHYARAAQRDIMRRAAAVTLRVVLFTPTLDPA